MIGKFQDQNQIIFFGKQHHGEFFIAVDSEGPACNKCASISYRSGVSRSPGDGRAFFLRSTVVMLWTVGLASVGADLFAPAVY